MASHLLWYRLPKGRVWHVACSGALVALCGQSIPARGERQPKRPPFGARPCPDCDNVSAQVEFAMCDATRVRHEQEHPEDQGPYEHRMTPAQTSEPLIHGLTVTDLPACEDCGHGFGNHDDIGGCKVGVCECDEYLAVCHCQHPWALHDVDTGECCYRNEETAEADAEPVCGCEQFSVAS